MATTGSTSTTTTSGSADRGEGVVNAARQAADTVAGAAGEVTARLPEVAETTRQALSEATSYVQRGSDHTVKLLGATSIGFALGLLVGGANRLLVLASLIPAGIVGATMLERQDRPAGAGAGKSGVQGR
jgi:ElaB/YqjD/DUF883 family membrane-anchored ribosome-binding protein